MLVTGGAGGGRSIHRCGAAARPGRSLPGALAARRTQDHADRALAADGGDWVRDASRPICRVLAVQWLELPESGMQGGTIDYVGCLLVHDPDRGTRGAGETVADHLYEVHSDRSLALIN
jgi:hypothetical protein